MNKNYYIIIIFLIFNLVFLQSCKTKQCCKKLQTINEIEQDLLETEWIKEEFDTNIISLGDSKEEDDGLKKDDDDSKKNNDALKKDDDGLKKNNDALKKDDDGLKKDDSSLKENDDNLKDDKLNQEDNLSHQNYKLLHLVDICSLILKDKQKESTLKKNLKCPNYILMYNEVTYSKVIYYVLSYMLNKGKISLCLTKMNKNWNGIQVANNKMKSPQLLFKWFTNFEPVTCSETKHDDISFTLADWQGEEEIETILNFYQNKILNKYLALKDSHTLRFLRAMYPLHFSDLRPEKLDDDFHILLKNHLDKTAFQKIKDPINFKFGDLLLNIDKNDNPIVSFYIGHGIVTVFKNNKPDFEKINSNYKAAYRMIPAFALSDFEIDSSYFINKISPYLD